MTGLAGDSKHNTDMDGESLVPLLTNPAAKLKRQALYWHYPHYYATTGPVSSIRQGDWKLLEYFEDNHGGKSLGRIHWVAIIPQQQGSGLAKPLLTAICKRLKELGHSKTYLTTQSVRLPAINLYAKFRFTPVIDSDGDREIWEKLQKYIKYPLSF